MDPVNDSGAEAPPVWVQAQRTAARRARACLENVLESLERAIQHQPGLEQEIRRATAADPNGRRRATMLNAVSVRSQAATLKALVPMMADVAALELQAWRPLPGGKEGQAGSTQLLSRPAQSTVDEQFEEIRRRVKQRLSENGRPRD